MNKVKQAKPFFTVVILFTLAGMFLSQVLVKSWGGGGKIYLWGMSGALFGTMLWNLCDIARKTSRPGKNTLAKYLNGFGLGFVIGSISGFLWGYCFRVQSIASALAGVRCPYVVGWDEVILLAAIHGISLGICALIFTVLFSRIPHSPREAG
jgi:hypothetical protein